MGSAPKHSVNACWQNEGMSGWQKTSQLRQGCQSDCVQTPWKILLFWRGPYSPPQSLQLERSFPPLCEDPGRVLWSVKGGKIPTVRHNPRFQEGFHSHVWTPGTEKVGSPLRTADNMLADAASDVIKLLTTCMTLSKKVAKALCLTWLKGGIRCRSSPG